MRLLIAGEPRWVTAPIVRGHGNQLVCDVKFDGQRDWLKKCLASLEIYYRKAPCYKETMDFLLPLVANREPRLADFNVQAVTALAQWMGIDVRKLVRSSTLKIKSSGTQRLIGLVRALNGTAYLCGGGAEGYQEEEMFQDSGLRVEHQCFVHPT
ncbi:MAG: WbqC family protein, partial [Pyrinomonadaceae bacterium]